jgi:hypothetical protein
MYAFSVRWTARVNAGGFAKMTYTFDSRPLGTRAPVSHPRKRGTGASGHEPQRSMAPLLLRVAAAGFLTSIAACQQPGDQYQAASQECAVWAVHTWQATGVQPESARGGSGSLLSASEIRPCLVHVPRVSIEQAFDH